MVLSILDGSTNRELQGLSEAEFKGATSSSSSFGSTSGESLVVSWGTGGGTALANTAGRTIRLSVRFISGGVTTCPSPSALYSFWIARDLCGASNGWVAVGRAGYNYSRDVHGSC